MSPPPIPGLTSSRQGLFSSVPALAKEISAEFQPSILPEDLSHWTQDLEARLLRVQQHPEQGMGFIEEHIRQCTLELQRKVLERAMQAKADAVDEDCPCCQTPLIDKKRRVPKTIHSY